MRCLFLVLCYFCLGNSSARALRITEQRLVGTAPPTRLQKLEIGLALEAGQVRNPYDPAEITVGAEFVSPDGKVYRAPGFWYQDFRRCTTCGPPPRQANDTCYYCSTCPEDPRYLTPVATRLPWRIRFAPPQAGRWSYRLLVRHADTSVASAPMYFTVAAAANPGFVQVHPNGRNFAFADGQVFFPLGMNVVNYEVEDHYSRLPYLDVQKGINRIADNGGNFARLMLAHGQFSPEGPGDPPGRYDTRQNRAYDLDALVELAARRRIYLQMAVAIAAELFDSDEFGHAWRKHPYRQVLAPGASSLHFFTDSLSRQLFRQRIRYVLARWGYSPAVLGLEMMNEADLYGSGNADNFWSPGNSARVGGWVDEMIAYARTLAPQHLYTSNLGYAFSSQYPGPDGQPLYQSRELDYVQDHYYSSDLSVEHQRAFLARRAAALYPGKPYQLAEFALGIEKPCWYNSSSFTAGQYPAGLKYHDLNEMHNTLWSSTFNGSGGAATYWWSNQVLGLCSGGQYHYFRPLQQFLAGCPIFSEAYEPLASACPGVAGPKDAPHQPTTPGNCVPLWAVDKESGQNAALEPAGAATSSAALEVFALRSPARVVGWVHNRHNYWYKLPHLAGSFTDTSCQRLNDNQPSTPDSIPALVGQQVTIPGMARPGRYRLEFFSTYPFYALSRGGRQAQGGVIAQFTTEVRAVEGQLTFTVPPLRPLGTPPFAPDYGFKATWLPEPTAPPKAPLKTTPKVPARKPAAPPARKPAKAPVRR
ncbi:DUF5060 domain-containing protein [Microvirga sp. STR05]|uniref:DUF5060 domain-containing protein n=1 Tax=Hymenobacter duratus TaxID=2771356 RepID=A0ABR8JLH4_9BACT|nr:DUF5060 domain-containing protein [Hymenobacter duratus]MBD2716245.1 DUF5060 domain-containing protein [Hymenobacter duratus]MBR7951161.1 DUF5060 domain-containing protein [Microvirga sp. STR05]